MAKTGRNQRCPCGSGKKYKHCHGGHGGPAIERDAEVLAHGRRREQQQGLGQPIRSFVKDGVRHVFVGKTDCWSPRWKTFHEFLRDFLLKSLGHAWAKAEQGKVPAERHPIVRWFDSMQAQIRQQATADGRIISSDMTGAIAAYLHLAYNVYLIGHHVGSAKHPTFLGYVERLKTKDRGHFVGALFETYAAAAFLKAGFALSFEDETDSHVSHVEFTARHPRTGRRFSVEVKARERTNGAERTDQPRRLGVTDKLHAALKKSADHSRVVFIDVNVPDVLDTSALREQVPIGWTKTAIEDLRAAEARLTVRGEPAPSAYVFVTNHPYHFDLEGLASGYVCLGGGFKIPDFLPYGGATDYAGVLKAREVHAEMFDLVESMKRHYVIPATFDGEIPEREFAIGDASSPLIIGRNYWVQDTDGKQVPGRLYDALIVEDWKQTVSCFELADGRHIMARRDATDAEINGYKRHPDTFFGKVTRPKAEPHTMVEWCDFFYGVYKDSTKERLLEFLANAPDIGQLRERSQHELAITYAERSAYGVIRRSVKAGQPVTDTNLGIKQQP